MAKTKYEIFVDILDSICKEAPEGRKTYHPDQKDTEKVNQARSRAYLHLFLKARYGLLEFEEREELITDDPGDGGVDAYFIDAESKKIYLIQSKFRTSENNFEDKEILFSELLQMDCKSILDGHAADEHGNDFNHKIKKFQRNISEIGDIGRYDYQVIILANIKNSTKDPINLKKITGGYLSEVYNFQKTYNDLVFPLLSGSFFNSPEMLISINLSNKNETPDINYNVDTKYGSCQITVIFVPTIEIARIMAQYKNSILKYNPRSYLDLKNDVNSKIKNTLLNVKTNEFALYNNGITFLSDKTDLNKSIGKKSSGQLIIINPQIINGGQTSYTLSEIYETTPEDRREAVFGAKEVLVKIITFDPGEMNEENKKKLIEEISKATNEQSVVLEADRRSNDKIQLDLQKKIFDKYGYLYERKKGEFSEGLKNKYIAREQLIDRVNFMRLCLSCDERAKEARSATEKALFEQSSFDSILYDDNRYEEYFVAYLSYRLLDGIQKDYKNKKENKDNINEFGFSLRYGKYAVVSIFRKTYLYAKKNFSTHDDILFYVKLILQEWMSFEEFVKEQKSNSAYFRETITKEKILDFDSYYKSTAINNDLKAYWNEEKIKQILE